MHACNGLECRVYKREVLHNYQLLQRVRDGGAILHHQQQRMRRSYYLSIGQIYLFKSVFICEKAAIYDLTISRDNTAIADLRWVWLAGWIDARTYRA